MINMPEVKIGIVAVSRDCFPESLSVNRRKALTEAYKKKYDASNIYECPICIVESEIHMVQALEDVKKAGCNALVVYLGNFGPEISETLLAKHFDGPSMFIAAAEESGNNLVQGRGDAYCGMLNASYNLKLRNIKAYIPEYPVGTAEECADMIEEFVPIARAVVGLSSLKIISFGPRPLNFLACNAPIKQLYNLGVEIEENSELDLFEAFNRHAGDPRIPDVVKDMEAELGTGNKKPEILEKLAQYELTLLDWIDGHRGYRKYVAIAGKCWPAFQTQFGFVPCYVNSRLTGRGIPVSCEVDIYGALSEFIGTCVSQDAVTLLDINNSVPADLYEEDIKGRYGYTQKETFMGFHCGNTSSKKLSFCEMKYQLIMARALPEEVTQGTLEGDITPGDITFYRLQSTADNKLRAYIAQGEVLPVATRSFGAIGIFAIPQMGRFYRHVLIEKNFPHHGAVAFGHYGKAIYEIFKFIGVDVEEIGFNQPAGMLYKTENPFA
ncbi:L-fucose/L-arabinose isomerase family protein [Lachnoclostridium pacaense]|uniref:L-fucose/L-arabinose isomerase family protein n=1 Tax=Enterocloster hominis (ex Hitch et al. 2024) TaxID=1917870 RepID=UPI001D1078E3|nr:L-fucose/L-arabinose isomerase family protein [Lachnoclostridium pacaense]MCC2879100.1 L-fucose/L-arabinose isomerase family protein [Lachnoclostridium pacaense]